MANEIQTTVNLQYLNPTAGVSSAKSLGLLAGLSSITGTHYAEGMMSVPTTAGGTAIPVSNLANLGIACFKNNDPTNYVDLYTAVSGTLFARLLPGDIALFRFNPGVTAPAAIAHTLAVNLEFLILEN